MLTKVYQVNGLSHGANQYFEIDMLQLYVSS